MGAGLLPCRAASLDGPTAMLACPSVPPFSRLVLCNVLQLTCTVCSQEVHCGQQSADCSDCEEELWRDLPSQEGKSPCTGLSWQFAAVLKRGYCVDADSL